MVVAFFSLILIHTHIQDRKLKAAVPPWVKRELEGLFHRNYQPELTAAWDPTSWDECFGLRSVTPDAHPCSIMNLEVKLAKVSFF